MEIEIPPIYTAVIDSPLGRIALEAKGELVTKIKFVEDSTVLKAPNGVLLRVAQQLSEYFDGNRVVFDLPLLPEGTHFQKNVWEELQKIPFAQTINYETLATRLGDKKVIRAAATANGKNPLCIVIPCHRVIGKDGSLTGYSGGVWRKKFLIDLEQKSFQPKLL
jgi:methylated-DNA-[protein]-cysteine S-methyltransferase